MLNQQIEGDDLEGVLVGGFEDDRARSARLLDLQPASSTHTPAVTRLQARETVLQHRGGEVVAKSFRGGKERGVDDAADRVDAEIFRAGLATAGAIEAGHGIAAAGGERLPEDVLAAVWIWIDVGHH